MPYSEPMFNRGEMSMNVILDAREELESELKVFTENRVKFSLERLFLDGAKNQDSIHCSCIVEDELQPTLYD